jgi:type II secretory pathway pseudopilin PulG
MLNQTPTSSRAGSRRRPRLAFTLVELLVVISIIILLVTMLVPAFSKVKDAVHRADSQRRVDELAMGCVRYAGDNRGLYPGQILPNGKQLGNGTLPNTLTGSQMLALCLFGITDWDFSNCSNIKPPTDANATYAPFSAADDMISYNGKNCSIWDKFSYTNKMPMLYYVSRLGDTTMTQYVPLDNEAYTTNNYSSWLGGSFNGKNPVGYIGDRRLTDPNMAPCNTGTFIIIGPGPDGQYGTTDDVKNFGN